MASIKTQKWLLAVSLIGALIISFTFGLLYGKSSIMSSEYSAEREKVTTQLQKSLTAEQCSTHLGPYIEKEKKIFETLKRLNAGSLNLELMKIADAFDEDCEKKDWTPDKTLEIKGYSTVYNTLEPSDHKIIELGFNSAAKTIDKKNEKIKSGMKKLSDLYTELDNLLSIIKNDQLPESTTTNQ